MLMSVVVVVVVVIIIMCLGIVSACMEVHVLCLWRPEEAVRFPGTGVTDGFEPSGRDAGNPT